MPRQKRNENQSGGKPPVSKGVETLPVGQTSHLQCHIHDKVVDFEVNDIRQNVCVTPEVIRHTDDKYYCLFHLPTKEKDIAKFEEVFKERLKAIEEKIAEIEKLPEDEREFARSKVSYDFHFVWFPSKVVFKNYKFSARSNFILATFSASTFFDSTTFSANTDFSSATFSDEADFSRSTFSAEADFSRSIFSADAGFTAATFSANTNFISAIFSANAYFRSAIFSDEADFKSATFSDYAYFSSTTFSADAYFSKATFEEKSRIFFMETKFSGRLFFSRANFKGNVELEGNQGNRLFIGEKALLDLQNVRIDDQKKISFHSVRLEPSWFINTNASEFVFTDCKWNYTDGKRLNVKKELRNLKNRKIENPYALLTKACWQLADNYEESKSFTNASLFRKFANESKRLETAWYRQLFTLHWWYYAVSFYGENWRQAFAVLLGILALFGLFYFLPISNFDYGEVKEEAVLVDLIEKESDWTKAHDARFHKMDLGEGIVHSLYVAALQRPEPKPADTQTKFFVILETIFAPLQVALLALAIRRKFMR